MCRDEVQQRLHSELGALEGVGFPMPEQGVRTPSSPAASRVKDLLTLENQVREALLAVLRAC